MSHVKVMDEGWAYGKLILFMLGYNALVESGITTDSAATKLHIVKMKENEDA